MRCFLSDEHMAMIDQLSEPGYLDGRYMAATFNALRGNDLIWSYVVNNYLMGEPYRPFDLLHWNGDTTNVPARWHKDYLERLYRRNELAQPGAISVMGTPIDLNLITTPCFVQAGERGPYRAGGQRLENHGVFERAKDVPACRVGAYRGRGQSSCGEQISTLGRRQHRADIGRLY